MEREGMMELKFPRLGIVVVLAAVLLGCGGGVGSPGSAGPPAPVATGDTVAPAITDISPANGAAGVSVDTLITVTFSEAVANVTPDTFRLTAGATQVPATVAADNGASATFLLFAPLAAGTTYTVTVTTGVTDVAGNHLAADRTWTFTTGADTIPPSVLVTYPANKATGVLTTAKIIATFSEPVTNVTSETFLLTTAHDGAPVPGEVTLDGRTATFTLSEPLFYLDYYGPLGMAYRAIVTTGVTDLSGNHLAADYSWIFTTDAYLETTPPTVVSVSPANGSTGVSVGTYLTVTFSEAVTNANAATLLVSAGGSPVPGLVTVSGSKAFFTPSAPLAVATTVNASVTTGVRDLTGNPLETDYSWAFTTDRTPDTIPPAVTATTPGDRATGVGTGTTVTATFSEPVTNVTDVTFLLTANGAPVPGTVTLDGPTATFAPSAPLANGPTYRATVTTGVKDLSGNALAADYSWSFTAMQSTYWSGPFLLESGSDNAFSPQVAMGGPYGTIVWVQSDGTADSIWATMDGTGMIGAPTLVETGGGKASSPKVAMNAGGHTVVVWVQSDGTADSVWATPNNGTGDNGWGTATVIDGGGGHASSPQVALDNNSNAVAVWVQRDRNADSIWANRYTPGTGWGAATPIENGKGSASSPRVDADDGGNAVVVWVQPDGMDNSIWANRYASATGWETPTPIEAGEGRASSPQVAMDGTGNAIAVWVQSDGVADSIWANRYTPGTGWGTATLIETGSDNASSAQVAMDNTGSAIAVWVQSDGIADSIWANRYVPETGWGTATPIDDESGPASSPQVAMDVDGYAIAVWVQSNGTGEKISSNQFRPSTGWGMPIPLSSGSGQASSPQVAARYHAHMVVWQEWDGTRYDIWTIEDLPPAGGCTVAGSRGGWKVAVGGYGPLLLLLAWLALRSRYRRPSMIGGSRN